MKFYSNKDIAKHNLDLQRSAGITNHPLHDEMLCNYADAAANQVFLEIQKMLPEMIDKAVNNALASQKVAVQVEESSLKAVKAKITDLFSGLFK